MPVPCAISPRSPPRTTTNGAWISVHVPLGNLTTCTQNVQIIPMHTVAFGNGLRDLTLNAMLNAAATTSPTADAFSPGRARL